MNNNERHKYPEDEMLYSWLPILLDTYYFIDTEYAKYIERDQKEQGEKITCKKGCNECCINQAVPITRLELQGISWYVIEQLKNPLRKQINEQLKISAEIKHCPFLIGGACSIYPIRPIACRVFFVYKKSCSPSEDVLSSRPFDILQPNREISKESAFIMLPFFGITDRKEQINAFESGVILKQSIPMHRLDLTAICQGIEIFDSRSR